MSYGLMAYAVDLVALRSAVGSKNDEVFQRARAGFQRVAERVDAAIRDQWIGRDAPSAEDVLRQLIDGSHADARLASAYVYALEQLCETFGHFLDNRAWSPVSMAFFDVVQEALEGAGVRREELRVHDLIAGTAPISIELLDDFPTIGVWEMPVLANAASALARVNFAAVPVDVRDALRALEDWVRYCEASSRALVCFCY